MNHFSFLRYLVVFLTVLCGVSARGAGADRASGPDQLLSPFGLNGSAWSHLGANTDQFDTAQGERRLALLKETGADWDRVDFWWSRIEPQRGEFLWRDYDRVVQTYTRSGVKLMPILAYASAWSNGVSPATDEERALYGRFVFNTVSRYRDRVRVWEIWNEPNIGQFWSPAPRARDYAALLQIAYREAKRADPTCTIVGAATAGIDYGYIEDLLELGCGRFMDALSIHPYQGDLGSVGPEDGGLVRGIGGLRKLLADHGTMLPIYITEMGHTTQPGGKVSEAEQADYLVRSYVLALAAGVHRLFWFNLHDWEEHWGLVRQDFGKKPSFTAYQTMTHALAGLHPTATLEFAGGARGVLFASTNSPGTGATVAVVWAPKETGRVAISGRRAFDILGVRVDADAVKAGPRPVFVERPRFDAAHVRQLPAYPVVSARSVAVREPPPFPKKARWTEPAYLARVLVVVAAAESTNGAPIRAAIPAAGVDFCVVRLNAAGQALGRVAAQQDLGDQTVVWMAPADARGREPLFYAVYWRDTPSKVDAGETTLAAHPDGLENVHLRLDTPDGKYIAQVVHKPSGWINQGLEVSGLFSASYNDSADGWPRLGPDAEMVETRREVGPVFARMVSHVRFGSNKPDYVWSATIYHDSTRIDWTGKWQNNGTGAKKFIHLGASFPPGTVVRGQYSEATLPQVGTSYGRWALMSKLEGQPEGVAMLLVAPGRNLSTPGWSQHAVVGVGSSYEDATPAQFAATMFILTRGATTNEEAERLYRQVAFPPAMRVSAVEPKPDA